MARTRRRAWQAHGILSPRGYASRVDVFVFGADGRILDIDKSVSAGFHGSDMVARLTALTS
jgi:hypothetical protein